MLICKFQVSVWLQLDDKTCFVLLIIQRLNCHWHTLVNMGGPQIACIQTARIHNIEVNFSPQIFDFIECDDSELVLSAVNL